MDLKVLTKYANEFCSSMVSGIDRYDNLLSNLNEDNTITLTYFPGSFIGRSSRKASELQRKIGTKYEDEKVKLTLKKVIFHNKRKKVEDIICECSIDVTLDIIL